MIREASGKVGARQRRKWVVFPHRPLCRVASSLRNSRQAARNAKKIKMSISKRLKTKLKQGYGQVMVKLLALLSLGLCFLPACAPPPPALPTPQASLSVSYLFTAEATYNKIEVNQAKLSYTYFEDPEGKCAQWVEQSPCWTEQELRTREARLSDGDLADLIALIQQTNFMRLSNTYGGAASAQRYYRHTLQVKLDAVEKTVVYQSFPEAEPMPEGMSMLIDRLHELVKARIGNKSFHQENWLNLRNGRG